MRLPTPYRSLRARRAVVAVLIGALVASACSSSSKSTTATTSGSSAAASTTASAGSTTAAATAGRAATGGAGAALPTTLDPSFYVAPDPLPAGEPGAIIRSQELKGGSGTRTFALLYRSTAVDGTPVAVSAVAYMPTTPSAGDRPVLAWAHGTTGLGDACSESGALISGTAPELAFVNIVTGQDRVVVATDYQGLGTPGPHPYLVNRAAGRDVLDSIRAVEQLKESGAGARSKAVVWGHSQGGGAAAFAAELQPTYAPDVDLVGVAAGAAAADFGVFTDAATPGGVTDFGFVVMALAGFSTAYPDVNLATLLTPAGRAIATRIADQCSDDILRELNNTESAELLTPAVATDPALAARLKENSAGYESTAVPVFLYHGDDDVTVPPVASKNIHDRYCAEGVNATLKTYPGTDHVSVLLPAFVDITRWLGDRLAGTAAPSGC